MHETILACSQNSIRLDDFKKGSEMAKFVPQTGHLATLVTTLGKDQPKIWQLTNSISVDFHCPVLFDEELILGTYFNSSDSCHLLVFTVFFYP